MDLSADSFFAGFESDAYPAGAAAAAAADHGGDLLDLLPEWDELAVDEDPGVLRAALDFIEACERADWSGGDDSDASSGGGGGGGGATPASPSPSDASSHAESAGGGAEPAAEEEAPAAAAAELKPAQPRPKPRRVTRNRRKEEIAELRVLVAELEQQLAGRKRKLAVPPTLPYAIGSTISTPATPGGASVDAVWKHVSKRQQQQRQLAELENAKLRNMVTDQLKIARELTREAKRRALLEGRAAPDRLNADDTLRDDLVEPLPSVYADESPLMVRIYPSRPGVMRARAGMAMPLASDARGGVVVVKEDADAALLDGTPVGAAWQPSAVCSEGRCHATAAKTAVEPSSHATRLAWQSVLRQFLKRQRAACSHEHVEEILEAAIQRSVDPRATHERLHGSTERGLLYTHRYDVDTSLPSSDDDHDSPTVRATPATAWQSSTALLGSLLSPQTKKKTVSLRLFRLDKPAFSQACDATHELDAVASQLGALSLRRTPASRAPPPYLQQLPWQSGGSLQASTCL